MAKTKTAPKTEQPEITLGGLIQSARGGEENARAIFFKQQGVREFLESLDREGYEVVKKDPSP